MTCVIPKALAVIGNGDASQLEVELTDHRPHPVVLGRVIADASGMEVDGVDVIRHRNRACDCFTYDSP